VADFMAPLGFGSQTAASLIRPAAYCGVCGFKPTTNSYDLNGVMGLSESLDTLGILAREPRDLALADAVLRDVELAPPLDFEDAMPRISLMRGPHWADGSVEMRDTCMRALAEIAKTGAETGETAHPPIFAQLTQAQIDVMGYEAAKLRKAEYLVGVPGISQQFSDLIEAGQKIGEAQYRAALETRNHATVMLDQIFRDTDALLVPSAPGPAPTGLDATGDPMYSRMWNLLQVPSIALPFGTDRNGLPLGIQLIGPINGDARLLDIAHWVHGILNPSS
jgi:amidase